MHLRICVRAQLLLNECIHKHMNRNVDDPSYIISNVSHAKSCPSMQANVCPRK